MEKIILQITSGKGPVECELAVALALQRITREALLKGYAIHTLNRVQGQMERTLFSVTIQVEGKDVVSWAKTWEGVLQWICVSPYRSIHKRKNWFIAVHGFETHNKFVFNEKDVQYTTMKASGPGGQHVNKTETAVRALHLPSNIAVTATESRSQHENKKKATEKLKSKVHD